MEQESLELLEIEAHLRSRRRGRRWVIELMLFLLAVTVALVAAFYLLAKPGLQAALGEANFQYSLGLALRMYADDNDGLLPPLSNEPGRLMYPASLIYPKYCADLSAWTFPADAKPGASLPEALIDDHSYWYLGYAVTSDTQTEALAEAYLQRVARGLSLEEDMPVAPGRGTNGGDVLYRLAEDLPDTGDSRARVPVMIQRPVEGRAKCLVLFLDGHVEKLAYPGPFPMSPATIDALKRMDASTRGPLIEEQRNRK